ncbi:hypothetical protein [Amycolatopsis sp. NPDC054798]
MSGPQERPLVTANGKNVATAWLEDMLRAHWPIDQCVVAGTGCRSSTPQRSPRGSAAGTTVAEQRDDAAALYAVRR